MDQEIKDLKEMLHKNLELSAENNKMLRSIQRGIFFSRIIRVVYWIIILGIAFGIYYYIEPYIDSVIGAYGSVKGDIQDFKDILTK